MGKPSKELKKVMYGGILWDARQCIDCMKWVPVKFFPKFKQDVNGKDYTARQSRCKFCRRKLDKERAQKGEYVKQKKN